MGKRRTVPSTKVGKGSESDSVVDPTAPKTKSVPNRRIWSELENKKILRHLLSVVQTGKELEKPNATLFYQNTADKLNLEDCSGTQIKNQVRNLKTKYSKALEWRNNTGQGVLLEEGDDSVKKALLKMCPLFDELDEIYGEKLKFDPPFLHDSSAAPACVVGSSNQFEDEPFDILMDFEVPPPTHGIKSPPVSNTHSPKAIVLPLQTKPIHTNILGKRKNNSGVEALADTSKIRFELQKEEISLARDKWEDEKQRRDIEQDIQFRRLENEEKFQMKKLELEEFKLKSELELAKFRIEEECKMKLEIAKLNINTK